MTRKEDTKVWLVKYQDGYTKQFTNPYRPMGNAVHHLNTEKKKGIDHIAVQSITCLPPESLNKPAKKSHSNGTMEASVMLAEKEEKELVSSIELADKINEILEEIGPTDSELDSELYQLIQVALDSAGRSEKLIIKLYEFTQDKDETYDALFLKEFVKRIRRSLYTVDDDLKKIEENLSQEEEE